MPRAKRETKREPQTKTTPHNKKEREQARKERMALRREQKFARNGITIEFYKGTREHIVLSHGKEIARCKTNRSALKRAHKFCQQLA